MLFKLFPITAVLSQVANWVCIKSGLYGPSMSTSSPVSFHYKFKIAMETRLCQCRNFNNFESSIILQFFKWPRKTIRLCMIPANPRKIALLSKNFVSPCIPVPRNSKPPQVFCKNSSVLKNVESFTEKHLYWSLVFNKVAGLRTAILKMSVPAT